MEDEKTLFLTELKELLAKYDAGICANYIDDCIEIWIGDKIISYFEVSIYFDNVFDFDEIRDI